MTHRFTQTFMHLRKQLQVPLAAAFVVTTTILYFVKSESAAMLFVATAAIAHLAVATEVMRALKDFRARSDRNEWEDHVDAAPTIKAKTITYCQTTCRPEVWCFGMTLLGQASLITTMLSHLLRSRPSRLTLHLAMLDPNWSELSSLNPAWQKVLTGLLAYLRSFIEQNEEAFKRNQWTVHIYFYRSKPSEFGLLAGDDLFLGTAYWNESRVLMAGQNRIKRLNADDGDEAREKIADFKTRFDAECRHVEVLGHERLRLA